MPYKVEATEMLQCPVSSLDLPRAHYKGFKPGVVVLPKGYRKAPGHRPFAVATVWERDVAISLRDGTNIRADIFRPQDADDKIPAIVAWGPYGKSGSGMDHSRLTTI